ncbi:phospholipase A and acyltransferase 4-like [Crassostrea virginica]
MSNPYKPTIGDLIEFNAGIYYHWAVYIDKDRLAHLVGCKDNGPLCVACENSEIRHDCFREVAKRYTSWRINNLLDKYGYEIRTADGIIEFTDKTKGPATYDIVEGNCEHYAMLCRYGVKISLQIENLKAKVPGFLRKYEQFKKIRNLYLKIKKKMKYVVIFVIFTCVVIVVLKWIRFCKKRKQIKK